jgi:hypothetical protein
VVVLGEKGFYCTNLGLENIVFELEQGEKLVLKIVDLEYVSQNFKSVRVYEEKWCGGYKKG